RVGGRADAIALKNDGSRVIIDYKTGQKIAHELDDVFSCIQVMMYADMLQKKGTEVSGGEFWYLRSNQVIACEYTPLRADKIEQIL
ncbi:MAG: PD-(D/E)XK nuclease family protein, partial [Spirochaetales bacterium]|nr:PD-(D/E)XK nuclease family protein [Spirochaetales bacterium]